MAAGLPRAWATAAARLPLRAALRWGFLASGFCARLLSIRLLSTRLSSARSPPPRGARPDALRSRRASPRPGLPPTSNTEAAGTGRALAASTRGQLHLPRPRRLPRQRNAAAARLRTIEQPDVVPVGIGQQRRGQRLMLREGEVRDFRPARGRDQFRVSGSSRHCCGSVGVAGLSARRRHHMDDAVAARLQIPQDFWQRGHRARLDVVQQQDALALGGEALHGEIVDPLPTRCGASRRRRNPRSRSAGPLRGRIPRCRHCGRDRGCGRTATSRRASPSAAVTWAMPPSISAFARSSDRRCMP